MQGLRIHGQRTGYGALYGTVLGSRLEVCRGVFQTQSSGRGKNTGIPGRRPRAMGREGLPHKSRGKIGTFLQEKWERTQRLVGDLAEMVEKASVIQEQECEASINTIIQMVEAGDFNEKAKVSRQRLLEI